MVKIDDNKIKMDTNKGFFIDTITKDINYESAIFELIDNSNDAAKVCTNNKKLSGYKVDIKCNKSSFFIEDNCGGMDLNTVKKYVFKLGNDNRKKNKKYCVGRYGIGMKRAFFKLGNNIFFKSITPDIIVSVNLNIAKWKKQSDWDIEYSSKKNTENIPSGTQIEIRELFKETSNYFIKNNFNLRLEEKLSIRYDDLLKRGISINLNGQKIKYRQAEKSTNIYNKNIENKDFKGKVEINMTKRSSTQAGWSIYFNGSLVVAADKTKITCWGCNKIRDGYHTPKFADKFNSFSGTIHLDEKTSNTLPYNTFKCGIDTTSPNYDYIKQLIFTAMKDSLPRFEEDGLESIQYKKPRNEINELKLILGVQHAKEVGEKTYEEFILHNPIDKRVP